MSDNSEYITIAEASRITGRSKQYFYKQLNNKFKQYVELFNGKKMLNRAILEEFTIQQVKQPFNNNLTTIKQQVELLHNHIKTLEDEIELLKQQLSEKDTQIAMLHTLLTQQQQLNLVAAHKQSIFKRLFSRQNRQV